VNPALPRSPAGDFNPWMIAVMLSITPFMEVLDSTIANVSLTHIAGSLGAELSGLQQHYPADQRLAGAGIGT